MITMNDSKLDSPAAIKAFLSSADNLDFNVSKEARYKWIAGTLKRTNYLKLRKRDKSTIREYLQKVTGYSLPQLKRLISQYKDKQWIGIKWVGTPSILTRKSISLPSLVRK